MFKMEILEDQVGQFEIVVPHEIITKNSSQTLK